METYFYKAKKINPFIKYVLSILIILAIIILATGYYKGVADYLWIGGIFLGLLLLIALIVYIQIDNTRWKASLSAKKGFAPTHWCVLLNASLGYSKTDHQLCISTYSSQQKQYEIAYFDAAEITSEIIIKWKKETIKTESASYGKKMTGALLGGLAGTLIADAVGSKYREIDVVDEVVFHVSLKIDPKIKYDLTIPLISKNLKNNDDYNKVYEIHNLLSAQVTIYEPDVEDNSSTCIVLSEEEEKNKGECYFILPEGQSKAGPFNIDELVKYLKDKPFSCGLRVRKVKDSKWHAWSNAIAIYPELNNGELCEIVNTKKSITHEQPKNTIVHCRACGIEIEKKLARKNMGLCTECVRNAPAKSSSIQKTDECFIATACYGTKYCSQVTCLRHFRDDYLLKTRTGHIIIDVYYRYSPSVAKFISRSRYMRFMVRLCLIAPLAYLVGILKATNRRS